jgi:Zn-dependent protease with chaperone function
MSQSASILPYHAEVRDYLRREEKQLWEWFDSNRVQKEHAEAVRFDLLKRTYRIGRDSQPDLYQIVEGAAAVLGISHEITLYQAQHAEGLNASLAYLPGEAHIVLVGPLSAKLAESELQALFGHELGHVLMYEMEGGDLLIASQLLAAMTNDRSAGTPHFETMRLFDLYQEVYCDRMAARAVDGDTDTVISMLVKVATGLDAVDAKGYLRQAEEVLSKSPGVSEGQTHPEQYIRARVLDLWKQDPGSADTRIAKLIQGSPPIGRLDFTAQQLLCRQTRQLLDAFFAATWTRTDLLLAHARLFFDDYDPAAGSGGPLDKETLVTCDGSLRDYLCYVLMDLASADGDLEEAPLAQSLLVAESLGVAERFGEIAIKEFRLRKNQYEQIASNREEIVAAASTEAAE